jgi:hypothetical protein
MGVAEAHSAARAPSMVIAALSGVGVEALAHTAARDASQHLAVVELPTLVHLAQQLYKSAQTRPAVRPQATLVKAPLLAIAAHNMGIVEVQAIIAAQAVRLVLGLVV